MGINHRICDFPSFSAWCNNSKDCIISGVFSALGAPRKVVDTFLESSTHVGPIIGYAISRIFQRGVIIPKIVAVQASVVRFSRIVWRIGSILGIVSYQNRFSKFPEYRYRPEIVLGGFRDISIESRSFRWVLGIDSRSSEELFQIIEYTDIFPL